MQSLKQKAYIGVFWSVVERFGIRGVSLFFSVFLARILTPEDYGLVAMPMIFLSVAGCMIDCGFSSALVRRENLTEEDLSTAFFFGLVVGIACYVVLWVAAPIIAQFYNTSILEDILKITSITTLVAPLCSIQGVLLTREVDFKRMAMISFVSSIVSGLIGIPLAIMGWGVWALVFQGVGSQLVRIVLFWSIVSWRPKWTWSNDSFKELFDYGSKMMISGLFNVAYNNFFPMIIGRFFNPIAVGNYIKANALASMPSQQATEVLQRVTYPVLCRMQSDVNSLSFNYRRMLRLTAFVVFPIMIVLAVAAKPVVAVLLGDQWCGVVYILQLLSIGMMLYPIHAINLNLLQVKGRSDLFLLLDIIKGVLGVVALFVTVPRGILWMAASVPVISFISLLVNTFYTGKMINVGLIRQLGDIFPILVVALLSGISVFTVNLLCSNIYIQLIVDIVVGAVVYLCLSYHLLRDDYLDMSEIIRSLINQRV